MNKSILIISIILMPILGITSEGTTLLCYNRFNNTTFDLLTETDKKCQADMVWGQGDICFQGDVNEVAAVINSDKLSSVSGGVIINEAKVVSKNIISYIGVDQVNFYGPSEREVKRCPAQ